MVTKHVNVSKKSRTTTSSSRAIPKLISRAKPKKTKGQLMVERMRGTATIKMTTDQVLAITRGRRYEKHSRR